MLRILDKREPARGPRPAPPAGDLFHVPKGKPMQQRANVPMIALVGFSFGAGVVRRWSRFLERAGRVRMRIKQRHAMEDVTEIGLEIRHARLLARAGVVTLEALAELGPEELVEIGLDEGGVEAVSNWQAQKPEPEPEPAAATLTDIAGVGPKTAEVLAAAGVETHEALLAVPDRALAKLGLSKSALDAIRAFRETAAAQ